MSISEGGDKKECGRRGRYQIIVKTDKRGCEGGGKYQITLIPGKEGIKLQ